MGKIKLVAIAPEDGWAFFEEDGKLFEIKPPFDTRPVEEIGDMKEKRRVVESAILQHEFWAKDQEFDSREALIEFLRSEIVRARNSPEFQHVMEQARRFLEGE